MLPRALHLSAILVILTVLGGPPAGAASSDSSSVAREPAQGGEEPGSRPPPKPMVAAVAVRGAAGTPSPLVITVVPAPSPPANAVSVLISGLPPGSTLSDGEARGAGTWRIGLKQSDGLWSVGLEGPDIFTLTVPPDRVGTVELKVTAVAVHGERGIATDTKPLLVTFDPPPALPSVAQDAAAEAIGPEDADTGGAGQDTPERSPPIVAEEADALPSPPPPSPPPAPPLSSPAAAAAKIDAATVAPDPPEPEPADDPQATDDPAGDAGSSAETLPEASSGAAHQTIDGPVADEPSGGEAANDAATAGPGTSADRIAEEPLEERGPAPAGAEKPGRPPRLAPAALRAALVTSPPAAAAPKAPAAKESAPPETGPQDPAPALAPAPSTAPAAAATASPPDPAPALPEGLLMQRGDALFAHGDLAGARLFYEAAADGGSGRAAFALARTYDPLVHRKLGVRGLPPDPATAADWYRKAIAGGNAEAEARLRDLTAWLDQASR